MRGLRSQALTSMRNIVGTTNNLGLIRFDMINELTFRTAAGFGAIASSPSTNLITDVTLTNGDRYRRRRRLRCFIGDYRHRRC